MQEKKKTSLFEFTLNSCNSKTTRRKRRKCYSFVISIQMPYKTQIVTLAIKIIILLFIVKNAAQFIANALKRLILLSNFNKSLTPS